MKKLLLTICLAALCVTAFGRPQRREVVIDTIVNAPLETMLQTAERFYYHFQACPDSLFQWAYVGIDDNKSKKEEKPTKESKNAIQLIYKDRTYDPAKKVGDVAIDIYVIGVRWWKDQHLGTICMQRHPEGSTYPLTTHMTATYSGSVLEGGDVIFELTPIDETHTRVHYEFGLTFGRVLAAFVSDKIWQNAIEWRFVYILNNLVEYAETGTVLPKESKQ